MYVCTQLCYIHAYIHTAYLLTALLTCMYQRTHQLFAMILQEIFTKRLSLAVEPRSMAIVKVVYIFKYTSHTYIHTYIHTYKPYENRIYASI